MTSMWFNKGKKYGDNELSSATIKVALVRASSSIDTDPDVDTVSALASGWELTASSGYSRATLSGISVTVDDTNNLVKFDASDVNFPSINTPSGTVGGALLILQVGGSADDSVDVPLCINAWGAAQTISGSFDVTWNSAGVSTTT